MYVYICVCGRRPKDEAAGDAKEAAASVMSPSGRSKGPATIWDRLYDDWSKLVKKKDTAAAATPPDCTFTPTLTHVRTQRIYTHMPVKNAVLTLSVLCAVVMLCCSVCESWRRAVRSIEGQAGHMGWHDSGNCMHSENNDSPSYDCRRR